MGRNLCPSDSMTLNMLPSLPSFGAAFNPAAIMSFFDSTLSFSEKTTYPLSVFFISVTLKDVLTFLLYETASADFQKEEMSNNKYDKQLTSLYLFTFNLYHYKFEFLI